MVPAILIVASIIQFMFGSVVYIRNTLLGRSKPNRVTFLIWAAGGLIGAAAGVAAGGGWALLPAFAAGFGPLLIFLASFRNPNAYWKLGRLDYVCGAFAVCALVLWAITNEPAIAVLFAILADGLAAVPTLLKAWRHPETETGTPYVLALLAAVLGTALTPAWSFSTIGFLVYLVAIDVLLMTAVYRRDPLGKLRREFAR